MSVNYYACQDYTEGMGGRDNGLHNGQAVYRREFLFRGHPGLGLTDCESWLAWLRRPGMSVVAESGYLLDLDDWWADVTCRPAAVGGPHQMRSWWPDGPRRDGEWRDQHGHPFASYEFF